METFDNPTNLFGLDPRPPIMALPSPLVIAIDGFFNFFDIDGYVSSQFRLPQYGEVIPISW